MNNCFHTCLFIHSCILKLKESIIIELSLKMNFLFYAERKFEDKEKDEKLIVYLKLLLLLLNVICYIFLYIWFVRIFQVILLMFK